MTKRNNTKSNVSGIVVFFAYQTLTRHFHRIIMEYTYYYPSACAGIYPIAPGNAMFIFKATPQPMKRLSPKFPESVTLPQDMIVDMPTSAFNTLLVNLRAAVSQEDIEMLRTFRTVHRRRKQNRIAQKVHREKFIAAQALMEL